MRLVPRIATASAVGALALGAAVLPAAAEPGGGATVVRGDAFFVDGQTYRTVLTPTTLPSGAPTHSFDVLYVVVGDGVADGQLPVAEAAPGQRGYNGGRWIVTEVSSTGGALPLLTSNEQVEAALAAGHLEVSDPDVARFVCPVIRL